MHVPPAVVHASVIVGPQQARFMAAQVRLRFASARFSQIAGKPESPGWLMHVPPAAAHASLGAALQQASFMLAHSPLSVLSESSSSHRAGNPESDGELLHLPPSELQLGRSSRLADCAS